MRYYDFRRNWTKRIVPHLSGPYDWRLDHRGLEAQYWHLNRRFAGQSSVNVSLRLAMLAEPRRPWRIVTSARHSTVWNGGDVLFDIHFCGLGISAARAWALAALEPDTRRLSPGTPAQLYFANDYPTDQIDDAREMIDGLRKFWQTGDLEALKTLFERFRFQHNADSPANVVHQLISLVTFGQVSRERCERRLQEIEAALPKAKPLKRPA
jgi:hypothetical protein